MKNLSDWDLLAVDLRGQPTTGVMERSPAGVMAMLERDRLILAVGGQIFCRISHGSVEVLDVLCVAQPGPYRGILAACWFQAGEQLYALVGATCLGFRDGGYVGADAVVLEALRAFVAEFAHPALAQISYDQCLRVNQGDVFIANGAGFSPPATPIGSAQPPLASPLLGVK